MTKSRTRKTTSTPKKQTEAEPSKAMDPSVREQATPETPRAAGRDAYAIQTLVNEVTSLFPEVTYETSNPNAYNTRLVVAFFDKDAPDLYPLLALVESDPRVLNVERADDDYIFVEFHDSLRTQDSRAPFGLAEAHEILSEGGRLALDDNDDFGVENDEDDIFDNITRTERLT